MGSAEVQFCSGQPLRARFGPNESVAGFGQRTDLRLPLDSKKSRFFRRPPRPDGAHGRFKNPDEITLAITTSGARASANFSRATNKGTYHIRLPIQKEADSRC